MTLVWTNVGSNMLGTLADLDGNYAATNAQWQSAMEPTAFAVMGFLAKIS